MDDVQDRIEDIRNRLVSISEELADLGIAALQSACLLYTSPSQRD